MRSIGVCLINKETNICENIAAFTSMQDAIDMFRERYILIEPVSSYGIGDIYKDGTWSKSEDPQPIPSEQRESAYSTLTHKTDGTPLITWEGQNITVNKASEKWLYYSSEGSETANNLSVLIVEAKSYIRELYPD